MLKEKEGLEIDHEWVGKLPAGARNWNKGQSINLWDINFWKALEVFQNIYESTPHFQWEGDPDQWQGRDTESIHMRTDPLFTGDPKGHSYRKLFFKALIRKSGRFISFCDDHQLRYNYVYILINYRN